jgi:3-hydroxy-3-methylglutaryl CoA synthase
MAHGFLFIAYIILALIEEKAELELSNFGIILAASLVPFGTFYVEKKYCKMFKSAAKYLNSISLCRKIGMSYTMASYVSLFSILILCFPSLLYLCYF